ncbi:hypothetical protein KA005_18915 [bacterium]|nr:hypothetical protein [bacterium]
MDGPEIYRNLEQVAEQIELSRSKTLAAVDDFIDEDIRPGDITAKDLVEEKGLSKDRAYAVINKMDKLPEFEKVQVYDPRVENIVAAIRPVESDTSTPS